MVMTRLIVYVCMHLGLAWVSPVQHSSPRQHRWTGADLQSKLGGNPAEACDDSDELGRVGCPVQDARDAALQVRQLGQQARQGCKGTGWACTTQPGRVCRGRCMSGSL